jgi:hypothetical protein
VRLADMNQLLRLNHLSLSFWNSMSSSLLLSREARVRLHVATIPATADIIAAATTGTITAVVLIETAVISPSG